MKLILRADVDSLGRLGEIVAVKPGFGRNYLIPQGLAMLATPANLKQFELQKKKLSARAAKLRTGASDIAERINSAAIQIAVRVGEGDKLYGSVTSSHIAEALAEKGISIDRRKIVMAEPIRALGEYAIEVRLHADVRAELKVSIVKHGQPAEQPAESESGQA